MICFNYVFVILLIFHTLAQDQEIMKKLFITTLFLVSISLAFAQIEKKILSIEGGVGFGQVYGNAYVNDHQTMRTCPQIGIGFFAPINEKLYFTTGFDYTKKGAWDIIIAYKENSIIMYRNAFTDDYKYITIPFMVGYQAAGKVSFGISGGFYTGLLMQHQYEVNTGILGIGLTTTDTDDYNFLDLGAQGQISLRLHANENTFVFLALTHQIGLTNTYTKELFEGGSLKTSTSYINFGVAI